MAFQLYSYKMSYIIVYFIRKITYVPDCNNCYSAGEWPAEKRLTFLVDMTTSLESSRHAGITQPALCDGRLPFVAAGSILESAGCDPSDILRKRQMSEQVVGVCARTSS